MESRAPIIALLACDMDGTLFRQDLIISDKVRAAIARAQQAGVVVVLATGRMPAAARTFVDLLGLSGPQIFSNGALVQTAAGKVVLHVPIAGSVAERVVEYCAEHYMHVNAYIGDTVYVARMSEEADFTRHLNRLEPVVVPNLAALVREQEPTKLVIVRLPRVEEGLLAELRQVFAGDVLVFSSVPQYIEMVNPLVDKGRALRGLTEQLGLVTSQVAAIGDGDNDITLFEAAGLPIAMGNATDKLKSIARYVVAPIEQDGVADAIDHYILAGR